VNSSVQDELAARVKTLSKLLREGRELGAMNSKKDASRILTSAEFRLNERPTSISDFNSYF